MRKAPGKGPGPRVFGDRLFAILCQRYTIQYLILITCDEYVKYDYHITHREWDMEKHISATRAVRDFSEVLNTIKFKGVHYIIERGGKPIASMKSIDEKKEPMTLGQLDFLLKKLPRLEEELDAFASDNLRHFERIEGLKIEPFVNSV